ncbi:RDD family protein [Caulobacter sp. 17J65-9]|uniref:RDD family protein n=1 Tax=Caulobacter sp. 17J65-9 TaxID=2709382 RepID=UPI0013C889FC|nr:RDD family protein [Caulobacter sp. 17J65-9]
MDRRWFYRAADVVAGPVSVAELRELLQSGAVSSETSVRPEGGEWATLAQMIPDLVAPSAPADVWTDRKPHPWRRYFARLLDNLLVGSVLWLSIGTIGYAVAPDAAAEVFGLFSGPGGKLLDAVATVALMIPAHALMIGLTGSSPGKWIFGVRVLRQGKAIGVPAAFARELSVWGRGMGLGVPLVSLFTLVSSYTHLTENGATPWDQGQRNAVVHRPEGGVQTALTLIGVAAVVVVAVLVQLNAALT